MFRLLVAGGRDYYDYKFIDTTLTNWYDDTLTQWYDESTDSYINELTLIHGDAQGVDRIAGQWAKYNNIPVEPHPANWKIHGKLAGTIRNTEMINSGVDYAILFPGGIGTANMRRQLQIARISCEEVLDNKTTVNYTR